MTNEKSYLKFWTGKNIQNPSNKFKDFEIRCYFDNDSDELINHGGKNGLVDLNVYRELLISIKKMGFNAIDIHDQLGRAEFYLWDSYKKYWDFNGDIDHIEKIIDIAHEEGLLVQIPMFLAWGFNHINSDYDCWSKYSHYWKRIWTEYMDSPIGKADIFILRPRSPIYDYPYQCKCDKCLNLGVGKIMTDVFSSLENIILTKKPNAKLICDLYFEGFGLFDSGDLKVSKNWLLMVANNGFGKLPNYKNMGIGEYDWGIYLHAGFWLNHTIQDPHLDALYNSVKLAKEKNLTKYIQVNGQSFKDFILNLEAIMSLLQFDFQKPENNLFKWKREFLSDWIERVFDITKDNTSLVDEVISFIDKQADFHLAIATSKAYLDEKEDIDRGFQSTMIHIVYPLIEKLNEKIKSKEFQLEEAYIKDGYLYNRIEILLNYSKKMLIYAISIEDKINNNDKIIWHDRFTFPSELFVKQYEFIISLLKALNDEVDPSFAKIELDNLYNFALCGSGLKGFEDWHNPQKARMHHPIPYIDIFEF